ncbi:chemotaxis protein CheA [Clostridium sp. SHJSY1]|uniref:chemotaxis protein CheA n=1 Tax=Clostridium sp. SHJSY1 TaxID=2942483 RepID=UPI002876D132|nr:chemotaxis protein CheA [Clostridium sp. SHJSY1]MDS0524647.1 chemotaxis protein CheA [Clostridium sp. SHJSY1]
MQGQYSNEHMLDFFIYEVTQNIEQLENCILSSEKLGYYSEDTINEIFRIMHTIKGSAAMMSLNDISTLAHSLEDIFFYLREQKVEIDDYSTLSDLVLDGGDYVKVELEKIKGGDKIDGDASSLIENNKNFLNTLKEQSSSIIQEEQSTTIEKQQNSIVEDVGDNKDAYNTFKVTIFFTDDCLMENVRAFTVINNLEDFTKDFQYYPEDIIENEGSSQVIKEQGFSIVLKTDKCDEEVHEFFMKTSYLKDLEFIKLDDYKENIDNNAKSVNDNTDKDNNVKEKTVIHKEERKVKNEKEVQASTVQSIISVNVNKLDILMDLVGELVITEAMVVQNPDLKGLQLDNFSKVARQLHKITSELQDMVMSIRMVPLSTTFRKMNRIVRDMSKNLGKEIELRLIGEETEVDKNIIEHISDPLMHLVRNSLDHGIETTEDRIALGKPKTGVVTLEAKNMGSDVIITVKDDGKGLNKDKILEKAVKNGILNKAIEEMTDKDIYNLIFLPGFSTKENVSEYSGRGVGMDVVIKNIETVGGVVSVESVLGVGSEFIIKIPLTLAIIDGMNIGVGNSRYTIPTTAIKESFRPKDEDIIEDPDGNEMIMVRGQCYPILRIHSHFKVNTQVTKFIEGIIIMVEQDNKTLCLFADELLGQQQVVVKALPSYIKNTKNISGLTGCTLLGDGSISLILDVVGLINTNSTAQM